MTTLKSDSEFYLAEERGSQASEEIVLKECNLSELNDFYVNSESLEYAIITLLKCFDRYNEGNTTPTRFNKLMYILNDELVKEDIDINLPYFWYLYGPVIPLNFLPEGLIKLLEKPWGRGIKISEHRRNDLPENIKTKIDIKAREIYDIYCRVDPRIMTGKVINDAYKKAPYVFQSKYKLFQRQITRKIRDKDILLRLGPLKMERDVRDLNELAKVFNRTDFPEVYSDLLQWGRVCELLNRCSLSHQLLHSPNVVSNQFKHSWCLKYPFLWIRIESCLSISRFISNFSESCGLTRLYQAWKKSTAQVWISPSLLKFMVLRMNLAR